MARRFSSLGSGTRQSRAASSTYRCDDAKNMTAAYYRVLKGGWFKGVGYKRSLGNLKGTLGSTREN